jgi:broad specificity polyphosphatase/5'/3'-nucleotidase SurE
MLINLNIVRSPLADVNDSRLVRLHSFILHQNEAQHIERDSHEYFWVGNSVPRSIKSLDSLALVCAVHS